MNAALIASVLTLLAVVLSAVLTALDRHRKAKSTSEQLGRIEITVDGKTSAIQRENRVLRKWLKAMVSPGDRLQLEEDFAELDRQSEFPHNPYVKGQQAK